VGALPLGFKRDTDAVAGAWPRLTATCACILLSHCAIVRGLRGSAIMDGGRAWLQARKNFKYKVARPSAPSVSTRRLHSLRAGAFRRLTPGA
jgi:hypothetical protein